MAHPAPGWPARTPPRGILQLVISLGEIASSTDAFIESSRKVMRFFVALAGADAYFIAVQEKFFEEGVCEFPVGFYFCF
jgi:hypothetical protein